VLGPYDQDAWATAADDLDKRPAGDLLAAVGYSLGANNVVEIAAELGRKIVFNRRHPAVVLGLGVDWSGSIMLPPECRFGAVHLQSKFCRDVRARLCALRAASRLCRPNLQLVTTEDLHPDVDNDAGVHGLVLHGLQAVAGS